MLARKKYGDMRRQAAAVLVLQRNVRRWLTHAPKQ